MSRALAQARFATMTVSEGAVVSSAGYGITVARDGSVYVFGHSLGGILKASIHKDGNCHYGVTETAHKGLGLPNQTRHAYKWTIPLDENVTAFRILIPASEMRPGPGRPSSSYTIIPMRGLGWAKNVQIRLLREPLDFTIPSILSNDGVFGRFPILLATPLPDGRGVLVAQEDVPVENETAATIAQVKARAPQGAPGQYKGLWYSTFDDGVPGMVEFALP